ncbi:MAG: amidohydrolase family protein, partial [Armatimonadota bacterium]
RRAEGGARARWSATGLGVLIPREIYEGGKLNERLQDPKHRSAAVAYMRSRLEAVGGPDNILITSCQAEPRLDGLRLSEAPSLLGRPLEDCVIDLVLRGNVSAVYFAMSPHDVRAILCDPNVMLASDSGVRAPEDGHCHPRNYGCFPRFLRVFVRENGWLTLEEAVHKMTNMPARKFRLERRGLIAPDYYADLTVFDPANITDTATYEAPWRFAKGVRWVLVNGTLVFSSGANEVPLVGHVLRSAATPA